MGARTSTVIDVLQASTSSVAVPTGRAFIVGTTGEGPGNTPTLVRGLAQYRDVFGQRAGGADMYDAVQQAFAVGLAEAYIVRGVGASAVNASGDIDDLTVTAKYPGAAANVWVATLTKPAGQKMVFTLAGPGVNERFTAATGADLIATINANSRKITVSGAVGDAGNVTLASGNAADGAVTVEAMLATTLGLGTGAVLAPGRNGSTVWQHIANHCAATDRLGLLTLAAASAKDSAKTAAATVAAFTGAAKTVICWPRYLDADGVAQEWAAGAAGLRAKAHAAYGPARSLAAGDSGYLPLGVPEFTVTDEEWRELDEAGVSVLRTVAGRTRIYGWKLVAGVGANPNLDGAQHADLLNVIASRCNDAGEAFAGSGMDGRGVSLGYLAGQVEAILSGYAASGALYARIVDGAEVDPGWLVDVGPAVNSPEDIAAGRVKVRIGLRLSPIAEFVTFEISVADAATALV